MKPVTHETLNDPYISTIAYDCVGHYFGALHEGKIITPYCTVELGVGGTPINVLEIFLQEQYNVGYSIHGALRKLPLKHNTATFEYSEIYPDIRVLGIPYKQTTKALSIDSVIITQWAKTLNDHYGAKMVDLYNTKTLYDLSRKVLPCDDSSFSIILGGT